MAHAEVSFGSNAYLVLAARAIRQERRPLTPSEMLEIAALGGFVPPHLFGATMHKTLSARLAEHIRSEKEKSEFYRTAPGTFFLHEIANEDGTPDEYRHVHIGHLRSKSIRKENVLVAPKADLNAAIFGEFTPYNEEEFVDIYRNFCRFHDRKSAEEDDSIKQFVTFTLVYSGRNLLIYRRGKFTTTSDALKGQLSVGFGGHVNDRDFDLFRRGGEAFRANAIRELREELFLEDIYKDNEDAFQRSRLLGYVNVEGSADARHHIAVLVAFEHISSELPKKGELSINQLSWIDLDAEIDDVSDYDLWSGMILKNLLSKKISLI